MPRATRKAIVSISHALSWPAPSSFTICAPACISTDALACAIAGLLDVPPQPGHGPLVAAVYRELLPAGRLPAAAHAALAMLHDLTSLEAQGVPIGGDLAGQVVAEAEHWVGRLCAGPSEPTRSNGEARKAAIALISRAAPEAR